MTKKDMIKTVLIEETRAWNNLVCVQDLYGKDSDKTTPELNRWMALRDLVRDFDLEAERNQRLEEDGLYNLPKRLKDRLSL